MSESNSGWGASSFLEALCHRLEGLHVLGVGLGARIGESDPHGVLGAGGAVFPGAADIAVVFKVLQLLGQRVRRELGELRERGVLHLAAHGSASGE